MKILLFNFFIASCFTFSYGQKAILNKKINGEKVGFWSEIISCDTIDTKKTFHTIYDSKNKALKAWSEGYYVNGLKDGFWKEYWVQYIPPLEDMPKGAIAKGLIKTIREYKKGVPVGLYVEYSKNGNIKVIGQFGKFVNETDETNKTFQWLFFDDSGRLLRN